MPKVSSNTGEQNEVLLKAFLVKNYFLKSNLTGAPSNLQKITELNFGPNMPIPTWDPKYDKWLADRDFNKLKSIFKKAKSTFKADVGINGINYSVKNSLGAMPAVINHTNRAGFQKVLQRLNNYPIRSLDIIIQNYWELRKNGAITEDVRNSHAKSPFYNEKEYFKPILEYFLFKGTGRGDSDFPADCLLVFNDPYDPSTYKIYSTDNAVDELWDKLIFSVRSKGMPKKYEPENKHIELAPWVMLADELYKGSLHIRSK